MQRVRGRPQPKEPVFHGARQYHAGPSFQQFSDEALRAWAIPEVCYPPVLAPFPEPSIFDHPQAAIARWSDSFEKVPLIRAVERKGDRLAAGKNGDLAMGRDQQLAARVPAQSHLAAGRSPSRSLNGMPIAQSKQSPSIGQ